MEIHTTPNFPPYLDIYIDKLCDVYRGEILIKDGLLEVQQKTNDTKLSDFLEQYLEIKKNQLERLVQASEESFVINDEVVAQMHEANDDVLELMDILRVKEEEIALFLKQEEVSKEERQLLLKLGTLENAHTKEFVFQDKITAQHDELIKAILHEMVYFPERPGIKRDMSFLDWLKKVSGHFVDGYRVAAEWADLLEFRKASVLLKEAATEELAMEGKWAISSNKIQQKSRTTNKA